MRGSLRTRRRLSPPRARTRTRARARARTRLRTRLRARTRLRTRLRARTRLRTALRTRLRRARFATRLRARTRPPRPSGSRRCVRPHSLLALWAGTWSATLRPQPPPALTGGRSCGGSYQRPPALTIRGRGLTPATSPPGCTSPRYTPRLSRLLCLGSTRAALSIRSPCPSSPLNWTRPSRRLNRAAYTLCTVIRQSDPLTLSSRASH